MPAARQGKRERGRNRLVWARRLALSALAAAAAMHAGAAAEFTVHDVTRALVAARNGVPADFAGRDLSGLDLSGLDFSGARLAGANLTAADLTDADFAGSDLSGARLDIA